MSKIRLLHELKQMKKIKGNENSLSRTPGTSRFAIIVCSACVVVGVVSTPRKIDREKVVRNDLSKEVHALRETLVRKCRMQKCFRSEMKKFNFQFLYNNQFLLHRISVLIVYLCSAFVDKITHHATDEFSTNLSRLQVVFFEACIYGGRFLFFR